MADGTRGELAGDVAFDRLIAGADVEEQLTIALDEVEYVDTDHDDRLRGQDGDYLELRVPGPPAPNVGQIVLDIGVDGLWQWHVTPPDESDGGTGRAGGAPRTYLLFADTGSATQAVSAAGSDRGLLGTLGKRVIKVLLFRVLEEGGRIVGSAIARRYEDAHRPHRLRSVTTKTLGQGPLNAADVGKDPLTLTDVQVRDVLTGGPTLLLIHGTASRTDSCFRRMPMQVADALFDHYDGRVIAFDHPTISYDPVANVRWLADHLPQDLNPVIDVLSHSRGGLLTRLLFERNDLGLTSAWFRKAVLVACPNEGTVLASSEKLGSLINTLTNVVGFVGVDPVLDVLEIVLEVVKHLAVGAFGGLEGLAAMDPSMAWITRELPRPTAHLPHYAAIGANFEPAPGSALRRLIRDAAADALFGIANDLVVPTAGTNVGHAIVKSLELPSASAVDHSAYWTNAEATDHVINWLH